MASTSYGRINGQFENVKYSFIAHFSLFTEKMAATYSFIGKLIYHTQLNLTENDIIPKKIGLVRGKTFITEYLRVLRSATKIYS